MAKPLADILGRQLRTSAGKADSRSKLMRAVRAAAGRLQLTDDDRHAIQKEVVDKASLADMTLGEIGKVLDHLNRDRPAPMGHRAHQGKVTALWWSAYWLGIVEEPNDQALASFVQRQTGLSALRFLDHRKAPAVIEALKAMLAREGVIWPKPAQLGGRDAAIADREAVVQAIWNKLRAIGRVTGTRQPYCARILGHDAEPTAHELDMLIRQLGKALRRALDKRVLE